MMCAVFYRDCLPVSDLCTTVLQCWPPTEHIEHILTQHALNHRMPLSSALHQKPNPAML